MATAGTPQSTKLPDFKRPGGSFTTSGYQFPYGVTGFVRVVKAGSKYWVACIFDDGSLKLSTYDDILEVMAHLDIHHPTIEKETTWPINSST